MNIVGHGYSRPRWVRKNFVPPLRPFYARKTLVLYSQRPDIFSCVEAPELTELGKKLCGLKKWKETNSTSIAGAIKGDKKKRKVSDIMSEEKESNEEHRKKKKTPN